LAIELCFWYYPPDFSGVPIWTGFSVNKEQNSKKRAKFAMYFAAFALVLFAGVLLAMLFGRNLILSMQFGANKKTPFEDMFTMQELEFPAMLPEHRKAFDVAVLHDDASKEWWYLNAHLLDQYNKRYTLMMAMLKDNKFYGILSDIEYNTAVAIAMPQVAVSHEPNHRLFKTGPATITQPDPNLLCYDFVFSKPQLDLDLRLCANKAPMAVGGTGLIEMGEGGVSRYYSLTNMSVSGSGRLMDRKAKFRGRGWIDRQWGNWNDDHFDRWDWFSINLMNQTEILLFRFWKNGQVVHQFGDVHLSSGVTTHHVNFKIDTTASWISPKTHVKWDTGWVITLPEFAARFEINADFDNHEVADVLWEGGVKVTGRWQGSDARGRGFYEARRKAW
jgi:predicted secreted hydrolase